MDFGASLISTTFATIATLIAGIVTVYLSARRRDSERTDSLKTAEEIALAAEAQQEQSRVRALELLAEKLPETESLTELTGALERIARQTSLQPSTDPTQEVVKNLINSYQLQALSQARVQFWFSLFASIGGFALI